MTKKKLVIELLGIGLPNRGAELMARTVMQKFQDRYGECVFCSSQVIPPSERENINIPYCDTNRESLKIKFGLLKKKERERFRNQSVIGTINDRKLDLIIDLSGFAYGDFWTAKKAMQRLGQRLQKWKKYRTPLFILPQAFGPFVQNEFKTTLLPSLEYASLVCPRDRQSQSHLKELYKKLKIYPDITFSFDAPIKSMGISTKYSLLIPNMKVFDSGSISKEAYFLLAGQFFEASLNADITPYILNHEGQRDLELCHELSALHDIKVLNPDSSIAIKNYIRASEFVLSSRFHGVVTSLATSTPVAVLGWTHKYEELMHDFDVPELIVENISGEVSDVFRLLTEEASRQRLTTKIEMAFAKSARELDDMWNLIFEEVDELLTKQNRLKKI